MVTASNYCPIKLLSIKHELQQRTPLAQFTNHILILSMNYDSLFKPLVHFIDPTITISCIVAQNCFKFWPNQPLILRSNTLSLHIFHVLFC